MILRIISGGMEADTRLSCGCGGIAFVAMFIYVVYNMLLERNERACYGVWRYKGPGEPATERYGMIVDCSAVASLT
jgi:hypothetical protein